MKYLERELSDNILNKLQPNKVVMVYGARRVGDENPVCRFIRCRRTGGRPKDIETLRRRKKDDTKNEGK